MSTQYQYEVELNKVYSFSLYKKKPTHGKTMWAYKLRTLGGHSETTAISDGYFVHYSNIFQWQNIPKNKIMIIKSHY